jgi:hypothetical protein
MGRCLAARDGNELPDLLRDSEPAIDRDFLYGVKAATASETAASGSGR